TNFRYVTLDHFTKGIPEFAMIDVSFISLSLILPVLKQILKEGSDVVTLIKPQFEAKKEEVGKKGIIRDPKTHEELIIHFLDFIATSGYKLEELTFSPITGGQGNIEFIAHLSSKSPIKQSEINVKELVTEAHANLIKNS